MITVLEPGLYSSVQDLGRLGLGQLGVPTAGAADALSLRIANRLVGNDDGAPGLEMTAQGAVLRFDKAASVAITGASVEANLDGAPVPMYQTIRVPAGAVLSLGRIHPGLRAYLAVAGGLDLPRVLGSASTDSLSGLGPAPLAAGMELPLGKPVANNSDGAYLRNPPHFGDTAEVRVLPGPQEDWFTPDSRLAFLQGEYRVLSQSDRTGLRLEGTALKRSRAAELSSMGMVSGAIQVPGAGQPIVLLANHGATGGYPVIANVISADLGTLAQLAPGARLRFSLVTRDVALAALLEQEERLTRDIVPADASLLAARALMHLAGRHASLQQAAVTDGGMRIKIRRN